MSDDLCSRPNCGHPFGPHAMIATTGDPLSGGITLCPVKGCMCFSTWSVGWPAGTDQAGRDSDAVYVPPMDEVEAIREMVQR